MLLWEADSTKEILKREIINEYAFPTTFTLMLPANLLQGSNILVPMPSVTIYKIRYNFFIKSNLPSDFTFRFSTNFVNDKSSIGTSV